MKNNLIRSMSAVFIALIAASFTWAGSSTETPALQVRISGPGNLDPLEQDRAADTLFVQLQDVFRRRGVEGRITQLDDREDPVANAPVLALNVIEWKPDRAGIANLRFTAQVTESDGTVVEFGSITGTGVTLGVRSRGNSVEALEQAATDAFRTLHERYNRVHPAGADMAKN